MIWKLSAAQKWALTPRQQLRVADVGELRSRASECGLTRCERVEVVDAGEQLANSRKRHILRCVWPARTV